MQPHVHVLAPSSTSLDSATNHRRPRALSQGERQRVAIARALVTQPAIVLADEPTAGLDPARSTAVLTLLEQLCEERGVTLLLVSHDPSVLARFEHTLEVGALSHASGATP